MWWWSRRRCTAIVHCNIAVAQPTSPRLEAGALVRAPILGATATVAVRYGYPGLILSLATKDTSLS